MKKLAATVLTFLAYGAVHALPVGNPSEASLFLKGAWWDSPCCNPCDPCFSWCDAWSLRIGYYGDFVFNRHMETDSHINGHHDLERTEMYTNAGYLALNICDRLDIFGTLGASVLHIRSDIQPWGVDVPMESELFFDDNFSWSVGGRATLWQCDCFAVGLEGQYFQTNPNLTAFFDYGDGGLVSFDNDNNVIYSEWQVGLGCSYRFGGFCSPGVSLVPYAAVKWSGSRLHFGNFAFDTTVSGVHTTLTLPNLKNDKLWGYAVGMTLTVTQTVGVTVEARFADEQAVSCIGQFRF